MFITEEEQTAKPERAKAFDFTRHTNKVGQTILIFGWRVYYNKDKNELNSYTNRIEVEYWRWHVGVSLVIQQNPKVGRV